MSLHSLYDPFRLFLTYFSLSSLDPTLRLNVPFLMVLLIILSQTKNRELDPGLLKVVAPRRRGS